jgi:hypothetical protein
VADNANVSQKFRSGWVACKREDYHELQLMSDLNSQFPDNFESGGLMLCKIPQEMWEQRNQYYQERAKGQMDAVDNNFLKEQDPRMPMLTPERSSRTTFGRG